MVSPLKRLCRSRFWSGVRGFREFALRQNEELILASASPRRIELLKRFGLRFQVVPSRLEEGPPNGVDPLDHAADQARRKAEEVMAAHHDDWVLGADTIVVLGATTLGKPGDEEEAGEMLRALSGREHQVVTAYCLRHAGRGRAVERRVVSNVRFKELTPGEIAYYVASGEPMDKAGAYAAQGLGAFFVAEIKGSYTNVVGLPLCEVVADLCSENIITFASGEQG